MTLDDPEHQNRGFCGFFPDFGLQNTFQALIAPKLIEIDMEKLHMKFSALNVDFDGPSLYFLCSRKPAHEGINERCLRKSHYFAAVGQSFVKTVACMLPITTSSSAELFRCINIDDFKRSQTRKIRGFTDFCDLFSAAHTS